MNNVIVYDLRTDEWNELATIIEGQPDFLITWLDDEGMIHVRSADNHAELAWYVS